MNNMILEVDESESKVEDDAYQYQEKTLIGDNIIF